MKIVKRVLAIFGTAILVGMLLLIVFLRMERYTFGGIPLIYPREVVVDSNYVDIDLRYESDIVVFLNAIQSSSNDEMRISIGFRFYIPLFDDYRVPNPSEIRIQYDTSKINRIYFTWPENEIMIWERN